MYDVVSPLGRQTEEERVSATGGLDLTGNKTARKLEFNAGCPERHLAA